MLSSCSKTTIVDAKMMGRVTTTAKEIQLQSILDILVSWSEKWQMKFNIDKCNIQHIGNNNNYATYTINHSKLSKVIHETDIRVTISNDLNPSKHCSDDNKLSVFIGRSEQVTLTLFNALIRPHLKCLIQLWSPYYRKNILKLERIQGKVTKMIPRL